MKSKNVDLRTAAFIVLFLAGAQAYPQINSVSVNVKPYDPVAPALRLTTVEISVRNHGSLDIESIEIIAVPSPLYSIELFDSRIPRLEPGQIVAVPVQIRTHFRMTSHYERAHVTLKVGNSTTQRPLNIQITPHPAFWPSVGGVFGAGFIWLLFYIFRRLSKEE